MLDTIGESAAILLVGGIGGILLGLAARLGKFCTLGMVEDAHFGQDFGRMWMWVTALGVAITMNFGADALGYIDLSATGLLSTRFSVPGALLGGLLFGYGMAQSGNCGYGVLARLGGGDIRALMIALVMGITATATIFGVLSGIRNGLFPFEPSPGAPQGLAHWVGDAFGLSANAIGLTVGVLALLASIRFQTTGHRLRRVAWGAVVGVAISSGFIGTYSIATQGFEPWPIASHTFTAPVGDTIHYAMYSTGLLPKFGIGSVLGVLIGSVIGSLIQDGFRWEACDDPRELRRQLAGAATMGFGAVLAAGCSVGQGLSALSMFSATAPLVAVSIWFGAWLGLKHLIYGFERAT
ncbi:hypothetical protein A8B78_21370 [Jannaschia sp. EhC01]|nr:hypothetical protein A8B78_21370 [Jannaschia sp. EhC01]